MKDIPDQVLENKTSCEELSQSQKLEALGQFAGGIAHDFNNILSIIEGYAQIAVKRLKEDRLSGDELEKILESTKRGAGITRQLLAFSRHKISINEVIDLNQLIKEQEVLLKPILGERTELFISLSDGSICVEGAQDNFVQILMNLAINARDAVSDKGVFVINLTTCNEKSVPLEMKKKYPGRYFARISAMDNGEGMSDEVKRRIFDPFFTTKEQGKGTGLGLSVLYGLIDQMGGDISVFSKPNKGTCFDIYFPLSDKEPEVSGDRNIPIDIEGSLSGLTILVAEDEPDLRIVLKEMFGDLSMNVLTAANGNEALAVQEDYEGRIDFLLTDVVMPEMDGAKLGELFQSIRPESKIIYMSGYPSVKSMNEIDLPDDICLMAKPLQQENVETILMAQLDGHKKRDAAASAAMWEKK